MYLIVFQHLVLIEKHTPGSYEKAILRFGHAETVVPFSCLLGLFLEGSGEWFHHYILNFLVGSQCIWWVLNVSIFCILYNQYNPSFQIFQNFSKYRRKNPWNSLQSLHKGETGGAALWHLLLVTTCLCCTAVQQMLQASIFCKSCITNNPFRCL